MRTRIAKIIGTLLLLIVSIVVIGCFGKHHRPIVILTARFTEFDREEVTKEFDLFAEANGLEFMAGTLPLPPGHEYGRLERVYKLDDALLLDVFTDLDGLAISFISRDGVYDVYPMVISCIEFVKAKWPSWEIVVNRGDAERLGLNFEPLE